MEKKIIKQNLLKRCKKNWKKILSCAVILLLFGLLINFANSLFQENGKIKTENENLKQVLTTGKNCIFLIDNALKATKSEQTPYGVFSINDYLFNGVTGTLFFAPINFVPNN